MNREWRTVQAVTGELFSASTIRGSRHISAEIVGLNEHSSKPHTRLTGPPVFKSLSVGGSAQPSCARRNSSVRIQAWRAAHAQ